MKKILLILCLTLFTTIYAINNKDAVISLVYDGPDGRADTLRINKVAAKAIVFAEAVGKVLPDMQSGLLPKHRTELGLVADRREPLAAVSRVLKSEQLKAEIMDFVSAWKAFIDKYGLGEIDIVRAGRYKISQTVYSVDGRVLNGLQMQALANAEAAKLGDALDRIAAQLPSEVLKADPRAIREVVFYLARGQTASSQRKPIHDDLKPVGR